VGVISCASTVLLTRGPRVRVPDGPSGIPGTYAGSFRHARAGGVSGRPNGDFCLTSQSTGRKKEKWRRGLAQAHLDLPRPSGPARLRVPRAVAPFSLAVPNPGCCCAVHDAGVDSRIGF
jgi:hypothetical protein